MAVSNEVEVSAVGFKDTERYLYQAIIRQRMRHVILSLTPYIQGKMWSAIIFIEFSV